MDKEDYTESDSDTMDRDPIHLNQHKEHLIKSQQRQRLFNAVDTLMP
jgi:hypothetical protein